MALSPPGKTRKSPRLGKPKQDGPSTCCVSVKKKLSLPKEECPNLKENKGDCEQVEILVKGKEEGRVFKRTKSPGVRVIGGRIYDSENGRTCHQCRQKTLEFMASCKNVIGKKTCTMNFCPKCLLNRYGEKVEDAAKSEDWKCPRCRGICNCSICMKRNGCAPTGILAHAAKATGFASVSDLLQCQVLSMDQVDALDTSKMKDVLESINSGNIDVKDLVKKLKPVQGSFIYKQSIESPLKNQSIPPLIHLLKDKKLKKSLNKSSAPSKDNKVQKPFHQSPTPLELKVTSQFEEVANSGKSLKSIKKKSKVKVKMNIDKGKLDIDNGMEASDTLGLADESIRTKKKMKENNKIKKQMELPNKALYERCGMDVDKKEDAPLCSTVSKISSPKIMGQVMIASEDAKDFVCVPEITEPLQRQKQIRIKQKQDKTYPSEISPNSGNVMPAESHHLLDAVEEQSKKRKLDLTNYTKQKDTFNDSEEQPTNVTRCNTEVAEKYPNRKKKKSNGIHEEEVVLTVLPQGKLMQSVAGIEFPADDVGQALQFLEFCSAFEHVLDLKKGHPESILRELMRGRIGRRGMYSSVVQFHVKLLSLIGEDVGEQCEISHSGSGENSWVQSLRRVVMKKPFPVKEDSLSSSSNQPSDELQKMRQEVCKVDNIVDASLRGGAEGYELLDPSGKLRLLNILCDETLSTQCLRNWIESTNTRFIESKKKHQDEVTAAKEKAKEAKQKMKDEVARILLSSKEGPPLTINEHDELISKVKLEAEKAQAAKLDVLEANSRMKRQRCDAIRTEPIVRDEEGQVFWRLKGGSDRLVCLLQDVSSREPCIGQDQWFVYNEEEENILAKYISLSRSPKVGKHWRIRQSPQLCIKMVESEPVCAIEIVLDEIASNAGEKAAVV